MTEEKAKYDTAPKDMNELKKRFVEGGGDWKDALAKVKEATGGKTVAAAMKEGWMVADFAGLLLGGDDEGETVEASEQSLPRMADWRCAEAPASFNVKAVSPQGYDVMLTLRDADTSALMERVQGALHWLNENGYQPTGRHSGGGGNSQINNNQGEAPLCPTHGKPMLASQRGSGWYCPVKIAEDDGTGKPVYCKQRVK